MQLTLFHRNYRVNYYTKDLASLLFFVVCLLCILLAPFFIGLAMQNFWLKDNYFFQLPKVKFTGRCALRVSTVLGKEYMWTCSENFNDFFLYGSPLGLVPYLSIYQDEGGSKDGVTHFSFTLSIPINNFTQISEEDGATGSPVERDLEQVFDAISSVVFLPEFLYEVDHYLVHLSMTVAPLFRFNRNRPPLFLTNSKRASVNLGPLSRLTVADLLFQTTAPLTSLLSRRHTQSYKFSPFVEYAKEPADLYNIAYFAQHYTSRNHSVMARVITETSGGLSLLCSNKNMRDVCEDTQLLNSFTWRINLRVQKAQLFYVPSFAESLKWAWVQYFAIAYIIQWLLWRVRGFVVMRGAVDTRAVCTRRLH